MAEFISLYSGSSGNCSVVRCGGSYLLVDMGKGVRVTTGALREAGLEAADCGGILITPEHSDHVKGAGHLPQTAPAAGLRGRGHHRGAGKGGAPAGGQSGLRAGPRVRGWRPMWTGFGVRAFPTSHDVPCVGYRIATPDGKTMAIATDLGVLTPAVHAALAGCDLVAWRATTTLYAPQRAVSLLLARPHRGARGDICSNDECSEKLLELVQGGCEKFALCHLSQENNTPPLALQTVFTTFGAAGVVRTGNCIVQTQRRNEISPALEFRAKRLTNAARTLII